MLLRCGYKNTKNFWIYKAVTTNFFYEKMTIFATKSNKMKTFLKTRKTKSYDIRWASCCKRYGKGGQEWSDWGCRRVHR